MNIYNIGGDSDVIINLTMTQFRRKLLWQTSYQTDLMVCFMIGITSLMILII